METSRPHTDPEVAGNPPELSPQRWARNDNGDQETGVPQRKRRRTIASAKLLGPCVGGSLSTKLRFTKHIHGDSNPAELIPSTVEEGGSSVVGT